MNLTYKNNDNLFCNQIYIHELVDILDDRHSVPSKPYNRKKLFVLYINVGINQLILDLPLNLYVVSCNDFDFSTLKL